MINVLLVDDQELIRLAFRMVFEGEDDIAVVGEASDGDDAVFQAGKFQPDVVLMDVRMPSADGIAATERILRDSPQTRVLILTTFDVDEYVIGAIRAGASGFLLKDAHRHEIVGAVRAVYSGDAVLAPRATRMLLDHFGPRLRITDTRDEFTNAYSTLTDREREVFLTLVNGATNIEIGDHLYLSESTVKTHVSRLLRKLGARDRIHAVILAHRSGLLDN